MCLVGQQAAFDAHDFLGCFGMTENGLLLTDVYAANSEAAKAYTPMSLNPA